MRAGILIALILFIALLSSGCVQTGEDGNETEFVYDDSFWNDSNYTYVPGDFVFKVHGDGEYWLKPNKTVKFYAVFKNTAEDKKAHKFIARLFPAAADFDVKAAYQCLHFTTCESLLNDMNRFVNQSRKQIPVNYTFVGLETVGITIPENGRRGTYIYNMIACKDRPFDECDETTANWGPNIAITVHVVE